MYIWFFLYIWIRISASLTVIIIFSIFQIFQAQPADQKVVKQVWGLKLLKSQSKLQTHTADTACSIRLSARLVKYQQDFKLNVVGCLFRTAVWGLSLTNHSQFVLDLTSLRNSFGWFNWQAQSQAFPSQLVQSPLVVTGLLYKEVLPILQ